MFSQEDLYRNVATFKGDVTVSWGYLTMKVVEETLANAGVRMDPDVLKMDIDSYDADLLEKILDLGYRPKVIMVEMNPDIPPPIIFRQSYSTDNFYRKKVFAGNYGASASAWYELMSAKHGYGIVAMEVYDRTYTGCPRCEHNIWFVAGEYLKEKGYRVATHEDMMDEYWRAHYSADGLQCIHLKSPCILGSIGRFNEQSGATGLAGEEPKKAKISKWLAECAQEVTAENFMNEVLPAQMKQACYAPDDPCTFLTGIHNDC